MIKSGERKRSQFGCGGGGGGGVAAAHGNEEEKAKEERDEEEEVKGRKNDPGIQLGSHTFALL